MAYKNKEDEKAWYQKNRKRIRKYQQKYYQLNKEKISKRHRKYNKTYKEKRGEYAKQYNKEYRKTNKKQIKVSREKYRKTHREQIRKSTRIYMKKFMKNPKHKLSNNISCLINQSLKGNKDGQHWESILNYTVEDLMNRLEKTLPKGMTWQDYIDGKLHIDHIIPISAFNFGSYDDLDFKRCFALKNLQFLEVKDNLKKRDKINGSFQPNLRLNGG